MEWLVEAMRTQNSTITVADYCQGLERREYLVNRDYQRSDLVWPLAARSFFIETILLDYPTPKMWLHQRLEMPSRKVVKEIVDGQQRSRAILDFYQDKLRLSKTILNDSFAGKKLSELDDEYQAQFLNYGITFDIFVGATLDDVREVFRRMNSFTVPLNPEESRHAIYQGPFKWFIHSLGRDYDTAFRNAGVFTEKQLNRLSDAKLLTEITDALVHGITTTSKTSLDRLYKKFDVNFPEETELDETVRFGLDSILGYGDLHETELMKPYNVYSLCLAFIQHSRRKIVVTTPSLPIVHAFNPGEPLYNLSLLAAVLADDEGAGFGIDPHFSDFADFILATKDRTNVASQRQRRFEFFLAALAA